MTITSIEDLRVLAQKRVPKMFYDYADSGSYSEGTYNANEADFQKIQFRQRVAVDMTNRTTKTKMVGHDVVMPAAIAPHRPYRYAACRRRDFSCQGSRSVRYSLYLIDHVDLFY